MGTPDRCFLSHVHKEVPYGAPAIKKQILDDLSRLPPEQQ